MELLVAKEEACLDNQQLTSSMYTCVGFKKSYLRFNSQRPTFSDLIAVRYFSSDDFPQVKRLLGDYEKVHSCMKSKIDELESEKMSVLEMEKLQVCRICILL